MKSGAKFLLSLPSFPEQYLLAGGGRETSLPVFGLNYAIPKLEASATWLQCPLLKDNKLKRPDNMYK